MNPPLSISLDILEILLIEHCHKRRGLGDHLLRIGESPLLLAGLHGNDVDIVGLADIELCDAVVDPLLSRLDLDHAEVAVHVDIVHDAAGREDTRGAKAALLFRVDDLIDADLL